MSFDMYQAHKLGTFDTQHQLILSGDIGCTRRENIPYPWQYTFGTHARRKTWYGQLPVLVAPIHQRQRSLSESGECNNNSIIKRGFSRHGKICKPALARCEHNSKSHHPYDCNHCLDMIKDDVADTAYVSDPMISGAGNFYDDLKDFDKPIEHVRLPGTGQACESSTRREVVAKPQKHDYGPSPQPDSPVRHHRGGGEARRFYPTPLAVRQDHFASTTASDRKVDPLELASTKVTDELKSVPLNGSHSSLWQKPSDGTRSAGAARRTEVSTRSLRRISTAAEKVNGNSASKDSRHARDSDSFIAVAKKLGSTDHDKHKADINEIRADIAYWERQLENAQRQPSSASQRSKCKDLERRICKQEKKSRKAWKAPLE